MALPLLLVSRPVATHTSAATLDLTFTATAQASQPNARVALALGFGIHTGGVQPASSTQLVPSPAVDVAFVSPPLEANPAWVDVTARARGLSTQRGRSYEFERMETGTASSILSNRDSALSPANTSSPYNPVRSTRPHRVRFIWGNQTYPAWRGITEGFPQTYPSLGKDSLVELRASDLFYALNQAKFSPGSVRLVSALTVVPQNTEQTITVEATADFVSAATGLPMPQVVPFEIQVTGLTDEWPTETMRVEEILGPTQYRVTRIDETTWEHPAGAAVTTEVVSFPEELSGARIRHVLERVGFTAFQYDLDAGQTMIAGSPDLASVNPLEHINLIAECEFGRFYVSRAGLFTFRDRSSVYVDNLTPAMMFKDVEKGTGTEVPYRLGGPLDHSDEKLVNHVRITIPSGEVVEMVDVASREQHFIRSFEREWPYANINDADSAARYILSHSAEDVVRLPAIEVFGAKDPSRLWPLLLAREIGDRCTFEYQPEGGGSAVSRDVVIDGIAHAVRPGSHVLEFQCTEVSSVQYWVLGKADYSELGSTTRVGF